MLASAMALIRAKSVLSGGRAEWSSCHARGSLCVRSVGAIALVLLVVGVALVPLPYAIAACDRILPSTFLVLDKLHLIG